MSSTDRSSFHNYPSNREAAAPLRHEREHEQSPSGNPILRGFPLTVAASLISSSNFIANFFYNNAGFSQLRELGEKLDDYVPCYNPAVVPILQQRSKSNDPLQAGYSGLRSDTNHTVAEYHELYLSKKLTPIEVVAALLPVITNDTKPAGEHSTAFLQVRADLAQAAAEASTQRYKQRKPLGILDGVPIAVKDEFDVQGYSKKFASSLDFTDRQDRTSWCVKKLQEAGAIVIGKTNMHEMGLDTTNLNPIAGTPRNPHNPSYYTGGSSGGSAYTIAAGIVPIALGADGGGSIRIPSSFCGIYGLKTSHDRVSAGPSAGLAATTGVVGPMAGSLDDLILAYRIMATPDPSHPVSSSFPSPSDETPLDSETTPGTKYIGVDEDWIARSSPPVKAIFSRLIVHYSKLPNYTIVPITIPHHTLGQRAHALTILSEIRSGLTSTQVASLTAPNKILMSVAAQTTASDFLAAQKLRALLMQHLAYLWHQYPGMVIATPTTPLPGWEIERPETDLRTGISDGDKSLLNMTYVWLANFTGCPAISWPVGECVGSGVPVGVMGTGEWGAEEALFQWVRDGERVWESVEIGSGAAVGEVEETGVRRLRSPKDKSGGKWMDVIAAAT